PLLNGWNDRKQRALREGSVADLAAAWTAQRPRLADRKWREVVVMHVALELVGRKAVQLLLVRHRAQSRDGQRLRLATGEEARAVRPGQHAHLDADLAHVPEAAAVRPHALFDDALPDAILDLLVEELAYDADVHGKSGAEVKHGLTPQLIDAALAGGLVRAEQNGVQAHGEVLVDHLDRLLGIRGRDEVALLLADLLPQLELSGADLPDGVAGEAAGPSGATR